MSSAIQSALVIESFDTLASRPVIWLWKFRLAMGKLAIFDGDPGLGKPLVTLDLCARVTRGLAFPDGSRPAGPGNVLLFHGEDPAEDVINPRLESLQADRARVFHVYRRRHLGPEPLCFPSHIGLLEQALQAGPAAFGGDRSDHGVSRQKAKRRLWGYQGAPPLDWRPRSVARAKAKCGKELSR